MSEGREDNDNTELEALSLADLKEAISLRLRQLSGRDVPPTAIAISKATREGGGPDWDARVDGAADEFARTAIASLQSRYRLAA